MVCILIYRTGDEPNKIDDSLYNKVDGVLKAVCVNSFILMVLKVLNCYNVVF